jgi:two-component system sensor histidine kinase TctE
VPLEVAPLVSSVNDLLTRLKGSIATQKRFLADAAHQLKTPLAGLRMQADLAQREGANAEELKQSLKQIGRSSMRATHTVNQLLALARAEKQRQDPAAPALRPGPLTREAVQDLLPRALDKRRPGLRRRAARRARRHAAGNPTLLKELIRNLVDNAINYTPSSAEQPGVVTARVLADPIGRWRCCRWRTRAGHPGRRARAGVPAVLPLARHQRRRLGPGPADRARDRAAAPGQVTLEDARPGRRRPGRGWWCASRRRRRWSPAALPQAA